MADEAAAQQIRGIHWRETFPFTHLFRAFRVAVHPSKLVLGLIALLALYCGGRLLDGLWRADSLAVPGEVQLYEDNVLRGGSNDRFVAQRLDARERIRDAYARRIVDLGVVANPADAEKAAASSDKLREVKGKILETRARRQAEAQAIYDERHKAAASIADKAQRRQAERDAWDAYSSAVRNLYADAYQEMRGAESIRGEGLFHALFSYEALQVNGVINGVKTWNWLGVGPDGRYGVIDSVINFFRVAPVWLMRHHPLYFVLFTLWFLTVWAIFGGAISRIAAIHVARDEKLSVRAALAFSLGKFLSFVSAPLIPLVIVLFVGLVPLIAGLLSSIPYAGPVFNIIMSLLFVLVLAAGFVMTLVLLGTFGGFNLMYPTIAVEGSDSFDAISRSFSYVYARPWRMVFYTLIAIIYGAICYLFVRLFIWLMLSLTHAFVGAGYFGRAPSTAPLWPTMWPGPQATLSYDIDFLTLRPDQDVAAFFIAFWVYLCVAMLGAFLISFYFSANTIIYYLMRREVDATEMDDVYLEQSEEDFTDTTAPVQTASAAAVGAVVVEPATTTPAAAPPPAAPSVPGAAPTVEGVPPTEPPPT
jgi:hypothetical protein